MFRMTFLGTGTSQGIPVIGSDHPVSLSDNSKDKRLRSSVLLNWDNFNLIIDCGPDFRQQMLRYNVTVHDQQLDFYFSSRIYGLGYVTAGPFINGMVVEQDSIFSLTTLQGDYYMPDNIRINSCFPNPFNPSVTINYEI